MMSCHCDIRAAAKYAATATVQVRGDSKCGPLGNGAGDNVRCWRRPDKQQHPAAAVFVCFSALLGLNAAELFCLASLLIHEGSTSWLASYPVRKLARLAACLQLVWANLAPSEELRREVSNRV